MSAENEPLDAELVPVFHTGQEAVPSMLASRGLEDVERDALTDQQIVAARQENSYLKGLSNEAVKIAVKKPPAWEYRLFFQTLVDEVDGYESIRQARTLGYMPGIAEIVPFDQTVAWMLSRMDEEQELAQQFELLFNQDLQVALGAPGESGDTIAIIMVSRQLGLIYKQFLEAAIRCVKVQHDPLFDSIFHEMSKLNDRVLKEFEEFPQNALSSLLNALAAPVGSAKQTLNLSMSLTMDVEAFIMELGKAEKVILERH